MNPPPLSPPPLPSAPPPGCPPAGQPPVPARKGPSAGVIAALVGGCVAGVAALAAVAWFALGGGAPSAGDRKVVKVGNAEIALRWCPPGSFMMGSPETEKGRFDSETQHRVTLTQGFWMGETEVTQGLWKEFMDSNPSRFNSGDDYPVEHVSWDECQKFLAKFNEKAPAGWRFVLPTEAQWEYACREGTTGVYGGNGRLDDMGWYGPNSRYAPHPVRRKMPNAWGLYDMHGNVAEWCADWIGDNPDGPATNPTGPRTGVFRSIRGGAWDDDARECRSARRNAGAPDFRIHGIGFRVALVPVQ